MSSKKKREFCSASEAAKLCGVSRQWWNILYKEKRIPEPVHSGSYMNLWRVDDVLEWKAKQR